MNKEFEKFIAELSYFGGKVSLTPAISSNIYHDIEMFFIDATNFMSIEPRITECFLNWLYKYGILLSPSKIRRLIKNNSQYDPYVLTAFISILMEHPLNTQNWKILLPYCKKYKTEIILFKDLPLVDSSLCRHFSKAKIGYKAFSPNEKDYLKTHSFVLKSSLELRLRAEGVQKVMSDLRAYISKVPSFKSLYEIAKNTFNPRNRINQCYRLMSAMNIDSS